MVPMGLGQESGREGKVVSWEAGESACDLVAMGDARAKKRCLRLLLITSGDKAYIL